MSDSGVIPLHAWLIMGVALFASQVLVLSLR